MTAVGPDADATLTVDDVDRLVAHGEAEPLLVHYGLVPVRYRQRWWHIPSGTSHYRPAPPATAGVFDTLSVRLAAAAHAVHVAGTPRNQRDA